MTTKQALYRELSQHDRGVSFLANVIVNGCSKPTTKLRNLKRLLDAGHSVQMQQFAMFYLTIDGCMGYPFSVLDTGVIAR